VGTLTMHTAMPSGSTRQTTLPVPNWAEAVKLVSSAILTLLADELLAILTDGYRESDFTEEYLNDLETWENSPVPVIFVGTRTNGEVDTFSYTA
jgi:hypothetical protein